MGHDNKPRGAAADDREHFLARWSRRKLDEQADNRELPGNEQTVVVPSEPVSADPSSSGPEAGLTDADMPPIDSLDEDSDFSSFLSPGVSDGLRRQALRKLFSQPAYNIGDGLNDYDEDFTRFPGIGKVITHEMRRMLQRELEAEKQQAPATEVPAGQADDAGKPVDNVAVEAGGGPEETETNSSLPSGKAVSGVRRPVVGSR